MGLLDGKTFREEADLKDLGVQVFGILRKESKRQKVKIKGEGDSVYRFPVEVSQRRKFPLPKSH